jgi:hypothetical protein
MAKVIAVTLGGSESTFAFTSIDRAAIYGKRRRVALDVDGKPCTRASLLDDGSMILRSGMTGQGYFLPDGTFVKQAELEGYDADGNPLAKAPSTLGVPQDLEGPVTPQEVLDLRVQSIYALAPETIDESLKVELESGSVYRFTFNFREDYRAEQAMLIANDNGFFALVGQPVHYEWSRLETVSELPASDVDSDDDDLDFDF